MFKRNGGTVDRIAPLALATVLMPSGLFWLGGLQGSVGGLFAAGIGGLALFTGLTGVGVLDILFCIPTPAQEQSEEERVWQERSTRIAGSYKGDST